MARVALDANVVIAFLDPGDTLHDRAVSELRSRLAAGDELTMGATAYAETLVRPLQVGAEATVDQFLAAAGVSVVPVDRLIARRAAALRVKHRVLRLPDALSLATALATDASFITFDQKLRQTADLEAPAG